MFLPRSPARTRRRRPAEPLGAERELAAQVDERVVALDREREMTTPSMSWCGSRSTSMWSLNVDGSPSSPLTAR
jgi:hypothetical protein